MKTKNIIFKNRKVIFFSIFLALILLLPTKSFGQVTFEASIENQLLNGTEISFEVFLKRTASNNLYLGNADFVLTFNSANFTNPTFEYEDGSNVFVNSNGTSTSSYNDNIVTDPSFLSSGMLVINISQPVFSNQSQFNSRIAMINSTPNVHKLGKFVLTGISNPGGTLGLQWKTSGAGLNSNAQTLDIVTPWVSSTAIGTYLNPENQPLPVELASFSVSSERNNVKLNWITSNEINNSGFDIERNLIINGSLQVWSKVGFVQGNGTTSQSKNYLFIDNGLQTGKYSYRLKQIDYNGNFQYFNLESDIVVGVPDEFKLSQNYPNPFNPVTKIDYDVPFDSKVSLKIYDMLGREVVSLINNDLQKAGYYTVQLNGNNMASGAYFFRVTAQSTNGINFQMTKKMLLIK